jgi:hypothetical protein
MLVHTNGTDNTAAHRNNYLSKQQTKEKNRKL